MMIRKTQSPLGVAPDNQEPLSRSCQNSSEEISVDYDSLLEDSDSVWESCIIQLASQCAKDEAVLANLNAEADKMVRQYRARVEWLKALSERAQRAYKPEER